LKPGKPPNELTSYRLISLLPIASKVFEKILLKMLLPVVENNRLIRSHQFFRQRHSTKEQTHRIVQRIYEALQNNQYCSAAFLNISQSIRQSMPYWISVQVKTVSAFELFLNPEILFI
jgi:hypothetical protein